MKPARQLRKWQEAAFTSWRAAGRRGIAAVVTGGGKTIFALHCLNEYRQNVPAATAVIVVPTTALLDQWLEEVLEFYDLTIRQVVVLGGKRNIQRGKINIGVINTVAKLAEAPPKEDVFLIVDECHKAASEVFRQIFSIHTDASLGLSATPERPYDMGYEEILLPNLGPLIASYTYKEALADKVIVPFRLINVVFDFEPDEQESYNKLTQKILFSIKKFGVESEEAVALMLKRARISNASMVRVRLALRIIARNQGKKILVFHEDIDACDLIALVLKENGVAAAVYHSRMNFPDRLKALGDYRKGRVNVLVTCRALDEGFNVPETEIGIIAASTATYRQRVQRLGRVLRPSPGKAEAEIYSLVAAVPEIKRLAEESQDLEGIAEVQWSRG